MIVKRPTPNQERWLRITARLALPRAAPELAARTGGWKSVSPLARCALFVLGMIAAGLCIAIGDMLRLPNFLMVLGITLIAAAEWLVAGRRVFSGGMEEALGLAGLTAVAIQFEEWIGGVHELSMSLLSAAVFAVAGFRFLNPLFVTLAAVALSFTSYFSHAAPALAAEVLASSSCFAVAAGALLFGAKQFRRPAHEQMIRWLIVTLPLCAYLWVASISWPVSVGTGPRGVSPASVIALIGPLAFGLVTLIAGLRRRAHAPLIAFMVCTACAVNESHRYTHLSVQARLIVGGCVLLACAIALERALRTPRQGITARRLTGGVGATDLLSMAGAAALAPAVAACADGRIQPGGGEFGGGGASGRY